MATMEVKRKEFGLDTNPSRREGKALDHQRRRIVEGGKRNGKKRERRLIDNDERDDGAHNGYLYAIAHNTLH